VLTAIAQCRKLARPVLVFPQGRYDFYQSDSPKAPSVAVVFNELTNLTIDGRGSTLVIHGCLTALTGMACRGLTIKDLTIDWEQAPFSQGQIIAVADNRRSFDVQVDRNYRVRGGEPVEGLMEYDPRTQLPLRGGVDSAFEVTRTTLLRPQQLRTFLSRPLPLQVGSLVVLRHLLGGRFGVDLYKCDDVLIERVTIYTCLGMGVRARNSSDLRIRGLRVMIRPESGRLMSTVADAAHFNHCKGTIEITDSFFEGMGDDAVNVHGFYYTVRRRLGPRTVEVECEKPGHPIADFQPGDKLELTDGSTLLPYALVTVKAVSANPANSSCTIGLEQDLPAGLVPGRDVLADAQVPRVRISGCTVRGNRARGFLIGTRDAVIENSSFHYVSGSAIHVRCDITTGCESIGTRRVVIRHNLIEGCNNGAQRASGAIHVFAFLRGDKRAPAGVHRQVFIEDNIVRDSDNAAVFLSSVDEAVVRGNRMENCCRRPTRPLGENVIGLINARNVHIIGNSYRDNAFTRRLIFTGEGCDRIFEADNVVSSPASVRGVRP
jgi:hypothetical protein